LRVFGGCLETGFVSAAWASEADVAADTLETFSWIVLPRSTKDSFYKVREEN
jgi:hypothetical protein